MPYMDNLPTKNRALPGNDDAEVSALRAELKQDWIRRAAAGVLAVERKQHISGLRRMLPAQETESPPRNGKAPALVAVVACAGPSGGILLCG